MANSTRLQENLLKLAADLTDRGDPKAAEDILHIYLQEMPLDVKARTLLAAAYFHLERPDLARQQAETAAMIAESTGNDKALPASVLETLAEEAELKRQGMRSETAAFGFMHERQITPSHRFLDAVADHVSSVLVDALAQRVAAVLDRQKRPPFYLRDPKFDIVMQERNALMERVDPRIFAEGIAFPSATDLIVYSLECVRIPGSYLEFGVHTGGSINLSAEKIAPKTIYGFDSFYGLPQAWGDHEPGFLSLEGIPPDVRSNVQLRVGWFEDTIPVFLAENAEDVAFMHVDCDIYSSTVTVLSAFTPRIKRGTIILFDEFYEEERRAFLEWAARENVTYRYLGYELLYGDKPVMDRGPMYHQPSFLSVGVVIT